MRLTHFQDKPFPSKNHVADIVQGDQIILKANGRFPKKIILVEHDRQVAEYSLIKTKFGKLLLNK